MIKKLSTVFTVLLIVSISLPIGCAFQSSEEIVFDCDGYPVIMEHNNSSSIKEEVKQPILPIEGSDHENIEDGDEGYPLHFENKILSPEEVEKNIEHDKKILRKWGNYVTMGNLWLMSKIFNF